MTIINNPKKGIVLFMPTIENGGIEKNLILLSEYFIKKKIKTTILTASIRNNIKNTLSSNVKIEKSKKYLNFNCFNNRINDTLNCLLHLIKNRELFTKNIFLSLQSHYLIVLICKILNIKIILRIANHPLGAVIFFQKKTEYLFKLFIKDIVYKFADGIICNSKESKTYFKKKKFKNRIISIYNPVKISKKKNIGKNKFNLIAVGRLEKQKNFLGIIKAIKIVKTNFPKIKLTIVGSGREDYTLKRYIKNNLLTKNVKMVGYNNPAKYLNNSGIFILNSLFEGLPNILLEVLTFKIPIISTNCKSGPKEILQNGKFGYLVNVNDYKGLSKKIIYVIKHYKNAKKKTELGFKSLDNYNYESQCEKYIKFLNYYRN